MTAEKIKQRISSLITHFTFEYLGQNCGVDPISQTVFEVWIGDNLVIMSSIEEVMNTPFFNGKSLTEITSEINIIDW